MRHRPRRIALNETFSAGAPHLLLSGYPTRDEVDCIVKAPEMDERLREIINITRMRHDPSLQLEWIREHAERALGILP